MGNEREGDEENGGNGPFGEDRMSWTMKEGGEG